MANEGSCEPCGIWERVRDLPLSIERVALRGRSLEAREGWTRRTTEIRLSAGGVEGRGEDVTYDGEEQLAFQERGRELEETLRGDWTLESLSSRLDEVPLFPAGPELEASRDYRRWGLESAALDLALRQSGRSPADLLDRSPSPIRFVASRSLDGPEGMDALRRLMDARPEVDLKLDAVSGWTDAMIDELAASGRVAVIDFKGAYEGTPVDTELDLDLYRRVVDAFPAALLEDPHLRRGGPREGGEEALLELLEPHRDRVTWDAPLHGADDIQELPWTPAIVNVKPSRFGTVRSLLTTYVHCIRRGIGMYGGGQFELGVGRTQIQTLASIFHPDAPNDVAPGEYNTDVAAAELPSSPLPPRGNGPGLG